MCRWDGGDYTNQVVFEANGKQINTDKCLKPLVQKLNEIPWVRTIASCCGHGQMAGTVIYEENGVENVMILTDRAGYEKFFKGVTPLRMDAAAREK